MGTHFRHRDLEQLLFIYSHQEDLRLDAIYDNDPYYFFSEVQHIFNLATEELVDPSGLEAWCKLNLENCAATESEMWTKWAMIASAYDRYLKLLHSEGVLDFASIQSCALSLMQNNPQVLAGIRKRYQDIFIDEYQDTNAVQDRIISLLADDGERFTAVGDDDQSIYRFRGATVRNILTFKERFPKAKVIKLEQNFRSKKSIVQNSQHVIENNPARIPKALTSVRGIGSDVLVVYERNLTEEAKASVRLLKRLHNSGKIANYGDIALLFRSVEHHALPYITALLEANMPFNVTGDARFFKRAEISTLCDLFRYLNITGKGGDQRYLSNSLFAFHPESCKALEKTDKNLIEISAPEDLQSIGIMDSNDQQRLMDLADLKRQVQKGDHTSMLAVYYQLLQCTSCACRFEQNENQNSMSNLGLLSQPIAAWDEYGGTSDLKSFLKYLDMLKQGGVNQITVPPKDAIQIMSIHQGNTDKFRSSPAWDHGLAPEWLCRPSPADYRALIR
ncbi:MAG: ATP-dependent helicase [Methanotrichaceae archaeon]|nr:ATP-dependent helicase [Methanotrichaceae archaeon]